MNWFLNLWIDLKCFIDFTFLSPISVHSSIHSAAIPISKKSDIKTKSSQRRKHCAQWVKSWKLSEAEILRPNPLVSILKFKVRPKQQIYRPGTPNWDIRKLCTVHCGRNVNKPSAPTAVEEKGLNADKQNDVTIKNKRN